MKRLVLSASGLLGFLGVVLGAAGAHVLRGTLSEKDLGIFETAVRYQLIHALALFILVLLMDKIPGKLLQVAGVLWLSGVLIFSGSLYLIVFSGVRSFGAVAPIGGLCLMAGWICIFIAGLRRI
ncbi:MAG: DUF423 domain-containing protein [Spirochaetia bacterium]|nr:DUF423 domain-containing protein [Spirochaetia bacterium]